MRQELVLPLEIDDNIQLVGGKAASLAELIRAGFNVPDGFVITTKSGAAMTDELQTEIMKHFDELAVELVAVRSSAAAEDSHAAAWAGQFDTFLNTSREQLIENVKKCWSSAKSDRAVAYAKEKDLQSGSVAVVVQVMVQGDISGVAFSVHPVTKTPGQMIIEAVTGLGEDLVSGKVTPDNYLVDKKSQEVMEKNPSGENPILNARQIKELAGNVNKIEAHFGFPVDVEWTFSKGELFILQSRPITTLK